MQRPKEPFRCFSMDEELERAKWFSEDMRRGTGWTKMQGEPGTTFWSKYFDNDPVPVKLLYEYDKLPIPALTWARMNQPTMRQEVRSQWDKQLTHIETLESYPDGDLFFIRMACRWPFTDRGLVLFASPIKEIEWYGRKSYMQVWKNAWHPSNPSDRHDLVRAINGGNFYISTPDEEEPDSKCKVFALSNNNFGGCLPNTEYLIGQKLTPEAIRKIPGHFVEGYKKFFQEK